MPNSLCNIIQNHRGRRFCEAHFKYCPSPQHSMYETICCTDACEGEFNCNMFFGHPYLGVKLPGIGLYMFAMLSHAVFWFIILALLEYRILQSFWAKVTYGALQIFCRRRHDVTQGASGTNTPSLIHFQTQNSFKLSVKDSFPFGFDRVVQDNSE
ncbi:unnamed protein product [Lymnaea stagnalis]|uniref:Uncharacterized protein n=1 Tax=Lymnaea stagnalis TaxID=6523 RepID=A0AAV2H6P6_LYMST